jgi:hypothetical protein
LISDINMPGASGLRLLENVMSRFPDIKVVLMTGLPTVEGASAAVSRGVFSYQVKPVNFAVLQRVVEQAAEVKALEDTRRELQLDAEKRSIELERVQAQIQNQRVRIRDPLSQIIEASRESGMDEMATRMMHFVGNVLNHAATSQCVMEAQCSDDVISSLNRLVGYVDNMLNTNDVDSPQDPRLRALPRYLEALSGRLIEQRSLLRRELHHMREYLAEASFHLNDQTKPGGSNFFFERCNLHSMVQEWIDASRDQSPKQVNIAFESADDAHLSASRYVLREALTGLLDFFFERALASADSTTHALRIGIVSQESESFLRSISDNRYTIQPRE